MKYQPRTRQKKYALQAGTITKITDAVERDSIRWNCSKSWIIATALAAFYGIDIIRPFETKSKQSRVLIDLKRFKQG
jgi:hypothetical protein